MANIGPTRGDADGALNTVHQRLNFLEREVMERDIQYSRYVEEVRYQCGLQADRYRRSVLEGERAAALNFLIGMLHALTKLEPYPATTVNDLNALLADLALETATGLPPVAQEV